MIIANNNPHLHSFEQIRGVVASAENLEKTKDSLYVATQLTLHGVLDKAREFIETASKNTQNQGALTYLTRLEKIRANLGAQDCWHSLQQKGHILRHLLGVNSIYLPHSESKHLIIVFSTAYNNFGISFPLLHLTLAKAAASVLYVKNPGQGLYCTGSPTMGGSIDELGRFLQKFSAENGFSKVSVLGFSGGGYAALFAAGCLGASRFIGFGVRTDWSLSCPHPMNPGRVSPEAGEYDTNTLVNLRHADNMENIGQASLYYGVLDSLDIYQAENMRGLPNFEMYPVADSSHNVILSLVAENRLEAALQELL